VVGKFARTSRLAQSDAKHRTSLVPRVTVAYPIEHAALRAGFQPLRVLQTPGYRIANSRAPRGSEPATRWPGCQSGDPSALTTSYGPWCIGRAKTTPRLVAGA
jgi:hypothetical protein